MTYIRGLDDTPSRWRFWRRRRPAVDVTVMGGRPLTLEERARRDNLYYIPVSHELFEQQRGKESRPVTYRFERSDLSPPFLVDLICTEIK